MTRWEQYIRLREKVLEHGRVHTPLVELLEFYKYDNGITSLKRFIALITTKKSIE